MKSIKISITVILMLTITAGSLYILNHPEKFSTTYQYHNIAKEWVYAESK